MSQTPESPVLLEAASLLLDRAAHQQFEQFLDALRKEREHAVRVLLLCNGTESVFTAKGGVQALDNLIQRMADAEKTLAKYNAAVTRGKKDT